jgi:hypothetical protein
VNNELERMWKEAVDDICLEGLRKTSKSVSQDSQCPIQNPNLCKYETKALLLAPTCLIS